MTRTRYLVPLVACVVLAFPAAAQASYAGRNGNIAVIEGNSDRGDQGDTDLRLLRSSGKVLNKSLQHCAFDGNANLPDERFCPSSPDFSRSGRKLAFAVDSGVPNFNPQTPDRLVVANADGTGQVMLPRLTQEDSEPAWTKSGDLLFTGKQGGKLNLYIVKPNGKGLRQITHDGGRTGAYSSRDLIAYVAGGFVRLIRPDGTHGRKLARGDDPDFSPSGRTVAYDRKNALFSKGLRRGAKRRRVTKHGVDPVFSPNGKRLLYLRHESDARSSMFTITPRGRRRKRIFRSVDLSSAGQSSLSDPAWQPRH
jgi:Tol biopolymer transport system component